MDLVNATRMPAGYTMGLDPDGRERIVVVAKGTFTIPAKGGPLELAEEQLPLVLGDEFYGEPGSAATPSRQSHCEELRCRGRSLLEWPSGDIAASLHSATGPLRSRLRRS